MTARDEILARVRAALEHANTAEVAVPRGYRTSSSSADLVRLFCERVADYRADVVRCAGTEIPARIADALGEGTSVVVPQGLRWDVPSAIHDTGLTATQLDGIDAVVTEATVGIAETGTIVLTHGPGQGRRAVSLVPDLHICIIRADQIVANVPDATAVLDPNHPTTWISGPSATSDIELNRVEGVHGPRRLRVLLVDRA